VRVLTSSVLVMEAIVLLLAIPVAVVAEGRPAAVGWVFAALALVCFVLPGMFRRSFFIPAGWAVQVAVLATGFLASMMFILGVVFAALWWTALRLGRKAEAAQAGGAASP
jgi:hypothetical protein